MNELAWLVGRRFIALTRREYDWVFAFDEDVSMTVACLWRLIESGRIRVTSEDDGHPFDLPTPVDSAAEVNSRLAGAAAERVDLRQGTLDVEFQFGTGDVLQILSSSAGYEAWNLCVGNRQFIAVGGGELVIFGSSG